MAAPGCGPGGVLAGAARQLGRMRGLASLAPEARVLASLAIVILFQL